jgi:threonine dehydrogenase-like Zn-dependent dehydrogenase
MREEKEEELRALLLTDQGLILRDDYPNPLPQPGEALIGVRLAGVCSTDLQLIAGYKGGYRGVLGHEFVGEVIAADKPDWLGQRVVGELNIGCGACELCRRGLHKHCRRRQSLGIIGRDGAFADFLTLPLANLHRAPDELSDEQAVFVEPLAAALQILEQVNVRPSSRVFVLGDGRLGLLVAQVLATTGCDLTVLGHNEAKLQILRDLGLHQVVIPTPADLDHLAAHPADIVVEVTGRLDGFEQARRLVRPQGVVVLKSTFVAALPTFDASQLVVDEITVLGSRCGPFAPAINLLTSGRIQTAPLVHACFALNEGLAALQHAGRKGMLKVLIRP